VSPNYDQIMIVRVTFNENFIYHIPRATARQPNVSLSRESENLDTKMSRSQQFSSYKRSKLIKIRTVMFILLSIPEAFMDIIYFIIILF